MDAAAPEFDFRIATHVGRCAHMVGIASSGMRGLAQVLTGLGWQVTGPDPWPAANGTDCLRVHRAEQVPAGTEVVIYDDAVPATQRERCRAENLGIEAVSHAEMLGRLMDDRVGIAVAGTHGKSTATAMTGEILVVAGLDPSLVVNAEPLTGGGAGRTGRGDLLLTEACEYRRNFLQLRPQLGAILGIEPDHFDCYANFDELVEAFGEFASQISPDGCLIFNAESAAARSAALSALCRLETFGFDASADWHPREMISHNGFYEFQLWHGCVQLGQVKLRVPGRHQVANALAAAGLAAAAGADARSIVAGLRRFAGLERRLELSGMPGGVNWIDDYAHHPTEVAAALATLREMLPISRVWCVFQPLRASRTAGLLDEFAEVLKLADRVAIVEISPHEGVECGEDDVNAHELAEQIRVRGGRVLAEHTADAVLHSLAEAIEVGELTRGDIIITMGAGDVGRIGAGLSKKFSIRRMAG